MSLRLRKVTGWAVPSHQGANCQSPASTSTSAPCAFETKAGAFAYDGEWWADPAISPKPTTLLADVAAGKYDRALLAVCKDIVAARHPLFVRWGHEMELSSNFGRYPWAGSHPAVYVRAYRHVVSLMKAILPANTAYFVWSPAGNSNCDAYYPGDDLVDFVGCSLYSWSAYNIPHGYAGSFKGLFDPKYSRLKVHRKPVMVCECGVEKGDNQAAWVAAAKAVFWRYPRLHLGGVL